MTDNVDNREARMVVLAVDDNGKPTIWCDPEIADIVSALNAGGIRTVASCSGHNKTIGNIALSDGRELLIASNRDEAKAIEQHFPDVNGEPPYSEKLTAILDSHAALAEALETVLSSFKQGDDSGSALYIDDDRGELAEMIATALAQAKGEA